MEDLDTGARVWLPLVYNAYLLFNSDMVSFVCKTSDGETKHEKHYFVSFCFVGLLCRWVRGDAVRQKFLFRVSCNGIFCVSPRLKSRSARGASRHIAFMVLFFHSCCYSRKWGHGKVQDFVLLSGVNQENKEAEWA